MKKLSTIIGIISSLIILAGSIAKFMHWPGAGVALTIGCGLFAFYALVLFMVKQKYAGSGYKKLVNFVVMLAMFVIVISFLFKMMHWPYAGIGLHVSHILLVILIPLLLILAVKEKEEVKKMNFFNETAFLIVLTAFSFIVANLNSGRENPNYFASLDNKINKSDTIIIRNNNEIYASIAGAGANSSQVQNADSARMLSNEMYQYIADLKFEMLMMTEQFDSNLTDLDTFHLMYLNLPQCEFIPKQVLFGDDKKDLTKGKAHELKLKMEEYKEALIGLIPEKDREGFCLGLCTDSIFTGFVWEQWEENTLKTNSLIGALTKLSQLQLVVRIAESRILNKLAGEVIKNQSYQIYLLKNHKDTIN